MRVLHLHLCYAIPSRHDKTYFMNPIFKFNTTITILHKLSSFFGPCNTLTLKLNLNTPMTVLHNPNRIKVNQISITLIRVM